MIRIEWVLIAIFLGSSAAAEQAAQPPPSPSSSALPGTVASPSPSPSPSPTPDLRSMRDPFKRPYQDRGDAKPRTELETVPLDQIKMVGVLTGPVRTRAMVLVPSGKTYVVAAGTPIGPNNGVIKSISHNAIKIVETRTDLIGERELVVTDIPLIPESRNATAPKTTQTVQDDKNAVPQPKSPSGGNP